MLREELSNFSPQNNTKKSGGHNDEGFILVDDGENNNSYEMDNAHEIDGSSEIDKSSEVNSYKSDIPTLSSIINDSEEIDSGPTIVKEENNIKDLKGKLNEIVEK